MFDTSKLPGVRGKRALRMSVVLVVLAAFSGFGMVMSFAAKPGIDCGSVFEGVTPGDPIGKVAAPATSYPGGIVAYTFTWHRTGAATADLTDCFRVDDGSNSTLNAIVEDLSFAIDVVNVGANKSIQTYVATITIPNDSSLIGHSVVNRAKMTHGSDESRTNLVTVPIVAPPCLVDCGGGTTTGGTTTGTTTGGTTTGTTTGGTTGTTTGGTTGGTTGTTTGGTTTGGTTGGTTGTTTSSVLGGGQTQVQGSNQVSAPRVLAQTGSLTTSLAWLGAMLMFGGLALRTRFAPRLALAASATDLVNDALRRSRKYWTCRG